MQGMTMPKLKDMINTKYNKTDRIRNLGNKLLNKTFRVSELVEIMEVLGYDIYLRKKN